MEINLFISVINKRLIFGRWLYPETNQFHLDTRRRHSRYNSRPFLGRELYLKTNWLVPNTRRRHLACNSRVFDCSDPHSPISARFCGANRRPTGHRQEMPGAAPRPGAGGGFPRESSQPMLRAGSLRSRSCSVPLEPETPYLVAASARYSLRFPPCTFRRQVRADQAGTRCECFPSGSLRVASRILRTT